MRLQQQIAEAIVLAFDELGGDPQGAAEAAMRHTTVESWIQQETTKIAAAGGAEMLIPGLHALTIPAGISYLMHKMAYISWGIGALKGAYVIETAHYSDLRNILIVWANGGYYNAHLLYHRAVSMDLLRYALTETGGQQLETALKQAAADGTENVRVQTLHVAHALANQLGHDERAERLVAALLANDEADAVLEAARARYPTAPPVEADRPMNRRISTRLAGRLAGRLSARVPARLLVGWIPVAGAVVNAFFNAQTLRSMANSASKYYDHAFTVGELQSQGQHPG